MGFEDGLEIGDGRQMEWEGWDWDWDWGWGWRKVGWKAWREGGTGTAVSGRLGIYR